MTKTKRYKKGQKVIFQQNPNTKRLPEGVWEIIKVRQVVHPLAGKQQQWYYTVKQNNKIEAADHDWLTPKEQ